MKLHNENVEFIIKLIVKHEQIKTIKTRPQFSLLSVLCASVVRKSINFVSSSKKLHTQTKSEQKKNLLDLRIVNQPIEGRCTDDALHASQYVTAN